MGWISPHILQFSNFKHFPSMLGEPALIQRPSKMAWSNQGPSCWPLYFKGSEKMCLKVPKAQNGFCNTKNWQQQHSSESVSD